EKQLPDSRFFVMWLCNASVSRGRLGHGGRRCFSRRRKRGHRGRALDGSWPIRKRQLTEAPTQIRLRFRLSLAPDANGERAAAAKFALEGNVAPKQFA